MYSWSVQFAHCSLILGLGFMAGTTGALAQVTTGGISGQVVDSSRAAIPEATVEVLNSETALRRTVSVNQRGNYRVLGLTPGGPYR